MQLLQYLKEDSGHHDTSFADSSHEDESDSDVVADETAYFSQRHLMSKNLISTICLSGTMTPRDVFEHILSWTRSGVSLWKLFKKVQMLSSAPDFHLLGHVFFAGDEVYAHRSRHEGVMYDDDGVKKCGIFEGVLGLVNSYSNRNVKLVLMGMLDSIAPDSDKHNLV